METAIRDATPAEAPSVTHRYYSPERLSNGREVGAWCYGLACGVFQPIGEGERDPVLVVEIPRDKLEGAAAVIVAAGGACEEVTSLQFGGMPAGEGQTLLRVALGL